MFNTCDLNLSFPACLTLDGTAPVKLALTGLPRLHNLLFHLETTGVTETGAPPDLFGLIFAVRNHCAASSSHSFVPFSWIHVAVVRAGLKKHKFPLLNLHILQF